MTTNGLAKRLEGMLRVGEAAKYLGVSRETLRNWDKSGRLVPTRHPVTGYRYYQQTDLQSFLQAASARQAATTKLTDKSSSCLDRSSAVSDGSASFPLDEQRVWDSGNAANA